MRGVDQTRLLTVVSMERSSKEAQFSGLMSSAVALTRAVILAACFLSLWSLGVEREIVCGCENLKAVVGKPFGEVLQVMAGAVAAGGWGEGEEGFTAGSQLLNLGAAPGIHVPGPNSLRRGEMGAERKGLEGG